MEKETEKERSDEDTVKQIEKERGDPGTWRKKRSPLCFWQNDSLPTNNAFNGFYSFFDLFIGKLDLLYAFNFFNLVLDLDSKLGLRKSGSNMWLFFLNFFGNRFFSIRLFWN